MAATEILVLSPHLDDGVLSLGAFIATASAAGTKVTVVTIFGGEPDSGAPAERWDGRAGFERAGDAARGRREEDRAACELLGAECEWLPFFDNDYGPPPADDVVWDRLASSVERAEHVFVPGRPLIHGDHAWVSRVVSQRADPAKLVFYAELPYDAWPEDKRGGQSAVAPLARTRTWTTPHRCPRTRAEMARDCRLFHAAALARANGLPLGGSEEPPGTRAPRVAEHRIGEWMTRCDLP